MHVDFGKAFSYIFDDPKWFDKVIIPILYGLIPVIGWMVASCYAMRVTRNVANRIDQPLPVCDFGEDLALGFKHFVVTLVYLFPFFIFGALMAMFNTWTIHQIGGFLPVLAMVLLRLLMGAYAIFLTLVTPIAQANVAVKNTVGAGFEFKHFFGRLSKNISAWLIVVGGSILGSMIAPIGLVAFGIGVIFTSMYAQLIMSNLEGQAYAASQPEVAEVVVETPPEQV
jgi:hypothetical protein